MKILIAGEDMMALHVATAWAAAGEDVRIITNDEAFARETTRRAGMIAIHADPTHPASYDPAAGWSSDVFVALLGQDHDNLAACLAAGRLQGVPRVVAAVHEPAQRALFECCEVDAVVSMADLLGEVVGVAAREHGVRRSR
jgi:Trk K+ transport system NAD-binding subunit